MKCESKKNILWFCTEYIFEIFHVPRQCLNLLSTESKYLYIYTWFWIQEYICIHFIHFITALVIQTDRIFAVWVLWQWTPIEFPINFRNNNKYLRCESPTLDTSTEGLLTQYDIIQFSQYDDCIWSFILLTFTVFMSQNQ